MKLSFQRALAALSAIALLFNSCGRVACYNGGLTARYSGFDSTDLSVLIVKRTDKDSKTVWIDTLTNFESKNGIRCPNKGAIDLWESCDWELTLALAEQTDRISDIKHHNSHQYSGIGGIDEACTNAISYALNGTKYHERKRGSGSGSGGYPTSISIKKQ